MKLLHKLSEESQIKLLEYKNKYPFSYETVEEGLQKEYWVDLTIREATTIHDALNGFVRFGISELSDLFKN